MAPTDQRTARVPSSNAAASPWRDFPYPGKLPVPCQLVREEVDYLHWIGAAAWGGKGRIVELGSLLGGSTYALASGMKLNPRSTKLYEELLTFDSFIAPRGLGEQFSLAIGEGESFRPIFDRYLTPHLDRVRVYEGWIPEDVPVHRGSEVYREQEPIEVLFIDCAKRWTVHLSVLRAFGPHLIPRGSLLVSQDFKSGLPWLMLHMHQLRECFEPVHNVPGTTVAFRYKGGIGPFLPTLWREGDLNPEQSDAAWGEIRDGVDAHLHPDWCAAVLIGRARHLRLQGRIRECVKAYEDSRQMMEDSLALDPAAAWRSSLLFNWRMAVRSDHRTAIRDNIVGEWSARFRRLENAVFPGELESAHARTSALEALLWDRVADVCSGLGHRSVALFGAGQSTRALLASGWPRGKVSVACVLDDFQAGQEIVGIPVLAPREIPEGVTAIIPSSAEHEPTLMRAARRAIDAADRKDITIVPVYTALDEDATQGPGRLGVLSNPSAPVRRVRPK